MRTETKLLLLFCPAFVCSCEEPGETSRARPSVSEERSTATVSPREAPPFELIPLRPRSVAVRWNRTAPARIASIRASTGLSFRSGDTLALATDTVAALELQRVSMEIDLLRFELQLGDSTAADRLDSLENLLRTGLQPSPVFSGFPGEVVDVKVSEGGRVAPGDTILTAHPASAGLVSVESPSGISIAIWPPELMGGRLVEEKNGTAVYSGLGLEGSQRLPGSWMVPRRALWEDGLDTFLMVGRDTVPATRLGSSNGSVLVIANLSGDESLATWGSTETEGTME
ncbi:hypothetical protein GF402_10815 [Candidatus Fermentibacteria bacterium]|nr:hypothetical protein [Candidatus Fermentibacteria bacterium]